MSIDYLDYKKGTEIIYNNSLNQLENKHTY